VCDADWSKDRMGTSHMTIRFTHPSGPSDVMSTNCTQVIEFVS